MPKGRRAWSCNPLKRTFNFLAAVCLVLSAVSFGWVISVATNPYGWFNPFPPAQGDRAQPMPAVRVTETASSTPEPTPEPFTPVPTPSELLTPAPLPTLGVDESTATQEASPTPSPTITISPTLSPSATPQPSPTRSVYTFTASISLQVHPLQLCDWMGVAGTVTDLRGKPALGAFVHVWGLGNVDQIVAAGANPIYGSSGWEVRLARAQIVGNWNVQLVTSPGAKVPLSDIYTISMPAECKRNLALVHFEQNH